MRKILFATVALVSLAGAAEAAPTVFSGSYDITANTGFPGLTISTADILDNPFTFDLEEGEDQWFTLFRIWTNEDNVDLDDIFAQSISAAFNFTAPQPAFGGTVPGQTYGTTLLGLLDAGNLSWNDPYDIQFGAYGDGILRVNLSNETFNEGFWDLNSGPKWGANVKVNFKLVQEATPVPEPATIALFGAGLLAAAGATRRRRSRAA